MILGTFNLIYVYLSYGFQLEYFSSLFSYVYQSPDFCYCCDGFSNYGTHVVDTNVVHASLSWKGLNLSNLYVFYNVESYGYVYDYACTVYVLCTFFAFAFQQGCAFSLPGAFAVGRSFLIYAAFLNLGLPLCALQMCLSWACFKAELQFEVHDSELFGSAWRA